MRMMETLWQDLRHGARMLAKSPGFSLVAIVSIAIGVGANAAMFSLADGLVLRPLPVPRPGDVVLVSPTTPGEGLRNPALSYRDYLDIRDRASSFAGLVAYKFVAVSFASDPRAPAQRQVGMATSGNLFDTLEVTPALGRWFLPEEDQVAGRNPVVVLDHDTWEQQFASDQRIVDRHITIAGVDFTVVGVAQSGFRGLDQFVHPAFYVPLTMLPIIESGSPADVLERRDWRSLIVKGHLTSDVTIAQARQDVQTIANALARSYPGTNQNVGLTVRTELQARMTGADATLVAMLMTLAFAVLLVACANVAGLLTSRAPLRAREIALRLAIGAGRSRVMRQLVTEGLLIAVGGGLLGLAIGYGGIMVLRQIEVPSDFPGSLIFDLDRRVLLVSLIVSAASVFLSSLVPAWQAARTELAPTLKDASMTAPQRSRLWGRNALVCGQVALALVVLTVAVLLYRGSRLLFAHGPGYRTDHLLMMNLDPGLARYSPSQSQEFYRLLKERALATPGVTSVALTSYVPMSTDARDVAAIVPEGYEFPPGTEKVTLLSARVDEGYFGTMGIRIISGRGFQSTDTVDGPRVAVVNETFARHYWPGRNALGQRFRLNDRNGAQVEVVGVAATTKYDWVAEAPTEFIYLQRLQIPTPAPRSTLLVYTQRDAATMASPLREVIRAIDPNLPIFGVRTMEDFYRARAVNVTNVIVRMVGGMGSMGLILALVGLYALVAYGVSRRTREIGIRMAVGARPAAVLRMVLRHGLLLAIVGIVLGIVVSAAMGSFLHAAFPASRGIDLPTYALVVPALLAVTLLAAYIPARRAARIDPLVALRQE